MFFELGKNANLQVVKMALPFANRHGIITGATGTGKTITIQAIAEHFSDAGVPVFMVDVKGDLQRLHESGAVGKNAALFTKVATDLAIDAYGFKEFPVRYWDCFADHGIAVRASISEIGPVLLSRMLGLNDVQTGILNVIFKIADEEGLLLIDLADFRALLTYASENASELSRQYGHIAPQSIAIIQRTLLVLENQGMGQFFGEPALNIHDFIQTDTNGQGMINVLSGTKLMNSPDMYSAFLLWLLSELYENLPEIGDMDKPKFAFFFDEAHLLFKDISKDLMTQIERVIRLIRSKGVGVYFCTQHPTDVPDVILSQLLNRVQHALRAYTPQEQKSVRVAAETFRANPNFDTFEAITALSIGEALVSVADMKGIPTIVERVKIIPPRGAAGAADDALWQDYIARDLMQAKYQQAINRVSAYEHLNAVPDVPDVPDETISSPQAQPDEKPFLDSILGGTPKRQSVFEAFLKSAMRQVGKQVGQAIVRGILGSLQR